MTPSTWQAAERMPSRAKLHPLPLDVAALVRAGHLHQVEPGVYRRAPRPTTIQPTRAVPPARAHPPRHQEP
jgi:hypothetical protein